MALTGLDRREVTPPVKFLHNAHINQNIHHSDRYTIYTNVYIVGKYIIYLHEL